MKKRYKLIFIIFICMSLFIVLKNVKTENKDNSINLESKENVYIYGDWNNNIVVDKDEQILVQIPIYDFNNEIKENDVNIKVNNFDYGRISDISLEKNHNYEKFTSYTASFYMDFDKVGEYNIKDITLEIETDNEVFSKSIGNFIVKVCKSNTDNSIDIIGGSALIDLNSNIEEKDKDYNYYRLNYVLKNNSDEKILIKNINLNKSDLITIKMDENYINPNEEKTIEFNVALKKNIVNSIIKPEIIYEKSGRKLSLAGTSILIADPVSIERLSEIIK